mgnify:CR=1 FL=1
MRIIRYIAIASVLVASSLSGGAVLAQSNASAAVPTEFPPASFTGRQYVDSKGCVFVRAGIDGNVTWVPRLARSRQQTCGFQPSLGAQVAKAPSGSAAVPAARSSTKVTPAPVAKPAAKPAPVIVAKPATAAIRAPQKTAPKVQPQIVRAPASVPSAPVKPVKVVTAQPKPLVKPVQTVPRASACRGASAVSSRYLTAPSGLDVRCGPQTTDYVTKGNGGNARTMANTVSTIPVRTVAAQPTYAQPAPLNRSVTVQAVPAEPRVVPRHVYTNRLASTRGVYIPTGYKPVWSDDRLNPNRAEQTFAGRTQMQVYWTNTVPRILVERTTGREAAYLYPGLQYPYTSFAQQEAAQVTISSRGRVPEQAGQVSVSRGQTAARPAATVSSRSAAPQRYVQAGVFADAAQAQRSAQQLANAGLPTKLGRGNSQGIVIVGPFQSQTQLSAALNRLRSMGFAGATVRN